VATASRRRHKTRVLNPRLSGMEVWFSFAKRHCTVVTNCDYGGEGGSGTMRLCSDTNTGEECPRFPGQRLH